MPPKKWSGKRDSNSRPPPWQGGALPLSYFRKWCLRAESNCRHTDFQSVALPTELPRQVVATPIGFEPTIFAVTGRHVNRYTTGPIDYFVSIPYFISFVNYFLYFFIKSLYFCEILSRTYTITSIIDLFLLLVFLTQGARKYGFVTNSWPNVVLVP